MIHAWPLVFGVSMMRGPRSLNCSGKLSTHRFGGSLMCPSAEIPLYSILTLLGFDASLCAGAHPFTGSGGDACQSTATFLRHDCVTRLPQCQPVPRARVQQFCHYTATSTPRRRAALDDREGGPK